MQPGDLPVVVWGRPQPHICLGQHQSASVELNAAHGGVPIVRRPLGGGAVWLDTNQACVVLVAPRDFFPPRTVDWYAHALQALLQVYREAGMPAVLMQQDIWLYGRKLAGSGAATIGQAGLVGSSFMVDFAAAQFALRIAAPSAGFRLWLIDALRGALTSWSQHAARPDWEWLGMVYRRAATALYGWRWEQSILRDGECAARETWRTELIPDQEGHQRLVPNGLKINAASYLTERHYAEGWVRVLTQERSLKRVALAAVPGMPEAHLADLAPDESALRSVLAAYLAYDDAQCWAQRILQTAYFNSEP